MPFPIIPHTWKKWDYGTCVAGCEWACVSALTCKFKGWKTAVRNISDGCISDTVAAALRRKNGRMQIYLVSYSLRWWWAMLMPAPTECRYYWWQSAGCKLQEGRLISCQVPGSSPHLRAVTRPQHFPLCHPQSEQTNLLLNTPAISRSLLCFLLLHQLFWLLVLLHCKLLSVQSFFLRVPALHFAPLLSVCLSLSFFPLSTWLAVICQIPPWRLLCLNQSELTSFQLICTQVIDFPR